MLKPALQHFSNRIFNPMVKQEIDDFNRVKDGDIAAYERIFKKYYERLCNFAHNMLHNKDESEEIVQHVFVTVWNNRAAIEIETSVQAYLYRAVNNHSLNKIKQLKNRQKHHDHLKYETNPSTNDTDGLLITRELQERLSQSIEGLPEQCRLIFQLSRLEGLKYQEIADELRLSVKTVENQIGKALKIMREELKEYLPLFILFFPHLIF